MRQVGLVLCLMFSFNTVHALSCVFATISFRDRIQSAKLVVLGTIVGIRGEVGGRIAMFKVENVLKGSTTLRELDLPFKETVLGPCDGTIIYKLHDRHLLLFRGGNDAWSKYPERLSPTEGLTAANVRRFLAILETQDRSELRNLYRSIFESGERLFLMEAFAALQRLSPEETDLFDRVLTEALAKSMGSNWEDIYLIDALVDIHSTRAAPVLAKLASSGAQSWPRERAIEALVHLNTPQTAVLLIDIAATDSNPTMRKAAQSSLAQLGDPNAAAFLFDSYATEQNASIRANLLRRLAEIHHPWASEIAMTALQSKSEEERQAAYRAVGELKEKRAFRVLADKLSVIKLKPYERQEILAAMVAIDGPESVPYLIPLVRNGTDWSRFQMISLLGKTGSNSARKLLQEIIQDNIGKRVADEDYTTSHELRSAVKSLLSLGSEEDISLVIALAKFPDSRVRSAAIEALGDAAISAAFETLVEGLSDSDTASEAATAVLKTNYAKGLPIVLSFIEKGNGEVLDGSLEMLEKKREMQAIETIERAIAKLSSDDILRLRAMGVIKRLRFGQY